MAAIDTSYFANDLAAMVGDMPCTAKFGSTEFTCAATQLEDSEVLMLTGNDTGSAIRLIFPITSFTVTAAFKPQARLQLKFPTLTAFTNYEIVTIAKSPDAVAYDVVLKADNRSA
jgi:hypothetical protein